MKGAKFVFLSIQIEFVLLYLGANFCTNPDKSVAVGSPDNHMLLLMRICV